MRDVRTMITDFDSTLNRYEFSDYLRLALSHDLVRPGFADLLDALAAFDSSAVSDENLDRDHHW